MPFSFSSSLDDFIWIVGYMNDNKPTSYYLFSRKNQQLTFLFESKSDLAKYKLSKMHPVVINTRDGLEMMCYLTIPVSDEQSEKSYIPKKPVPLILNVHGGPTVRDSWGLDVEGQWLANRGYAVLNINYRGSSGFGKNFINAGNGEWAGKMHDDLIDAMNWAIQNKITTKDQVCIYGGSYGGYAALVGLTFTPDTFVCGVDIVGPSDLKTLLKNIPPYWQSGYKALIKKIGGDPDTKAGEEFLASRSPLTFVEKIKKPLLIGQGAHDPRVKKEQSDLIVAAMKKNNIPVTYALYTDEGHGFMRPENRLSFYAITEEFLHKHLGGRREPMQKVNNTSLEIVEKGGLELNGY
jgi:dipeptidyl aminopeptidase/acylaminoacyl peptidase